MYLYLAVCSYYQGWRSKFEQFGPKLNISFYFHDDKHVLLQLQNKKLKAQVEVSLKSKKP